MNSLTRFSPIALLALSVLILTAGCKSNQNAANTGQNAADTSQAAGQDSSSDPASANLAPVSTSGAAPSPAAPSTASDQSAPAPAAPAPAASAPQAADTSAAVSDVPPATADDTSYGAQPVATAPQPPPALPEYQQPPAPSDDYLWTPGYWNYAAAGYYWVPGVWVQAPYQGALWTPGYWGIYHGHYGFFHGYWGPHIGFYGGVNYGFGYGGTGYQGGYWRTGHFFYNRSVNNINVTSIHNVYEYKVVTNNNVRVSFNGGPGGLQVRARPAELIAFREPHAAPMRTQIEIEHTASTNRANFVSENHGRPASAVIERPVVADRDVHPVAPPPVHNQPMRPEMHPNAPPVRGGEPARPEGRPIPPPHNEPGHPAERPAPRPEAAQHPAPHPEVKPQPEERPAPHAAPKPPPHEPGKPEPPKRENQHPQ